MDGWLANFQGTKFDHCSGQQGEGASEGIAVEEGQLNPFLNILPGLALCELTQN